MGDAIKLLWHTEAMLVVDKPAGLAVQAPPGIESVETRLREQLGEQIDYLAFPHRLDRPVSGALMVAVRKRAARLLSEQLAARKIDKRYLAEVQGRVDADPHVWQDFVRKREGIAQVEICGPDDPRGKHAETHVNVVRYREADHVTLLGLNPVTGRMHQLRVQAASRGHPIVGDQLYGSPPAATAAASESPADRAMAGGRIRLHAASITFHDPVNGVRTEVESPCWFA